MSETAVATQERAPAFNLLDEPWIPVRRPDGRLDEVGLLTLFRQSRDIEGLAETSPPSLVALHRLLLAVTHRALTNGVGRWVTDDRVRWYNEGLPITALVNYLEHWRERFWLFHPTHPFMQVAALAESVETRDRIKPWTNISLGHASGDNPAIFDHSVGTAISPIAAAEATRHLLGFLQFVPGGLVQVLRTADNGGPLANSAAVLATGRNFSETMVLGLHPWKHDASDAPSWECPRPEITTLCALPTLAKGPNDRYTRQTRAVLFRNEVSDEAMVRALWLAEGIALAKDGIEPDPASAQLVSDGKSRPVRFTEGRAFWRDLPALLPAPDSGARASISPACMTWAYNVIANLNEAEPAIAFQVAGVSSGARPAKMARWRIERHSLPAGLLSVGDTSAAVAMQIARAEQLYFKLLAVAAEMFAKALPRADPKTERTRQAAWKRARAGQYASESLMETLDRSLCAASYFSTLEHQLPQMIRAVAAGDIEGAHERWSATLLQAANAGWSAACDSLGPSAGAIRARALMHDRFQYLIRRLRPIAVAATDSLDVTDPETAA